MDTRFAKIVSDPDGRDYLYVEGFVVPLAISNVEENNRFVEAIVQGLRRQEGEFVFAQSVQGAAIGEGASQAVGY